jgi:ABC-type amino acid transport substrate-binding protein
MMVWGHRNGRVIRKRKSIALSHVKRNLLQVFLLALSLLGLAQSVWAEPGLERVKKAGKLLIAVDASYPPMEFEGPKGQPIGFDVDLGEELAKKLGVKAEFIVMSWDGILAGLTSKRYDVIMSSMNITADRQKQVDFVEYVKLSQLFVARPGTKLDQEKALDGKVIAVQADTTSSDYVEAVKKKGIAIKEIKAFKTAIDCFAALKAKHVDGIVIDEPVGRYYQKQDAKSFEITGKAMSPEPVGIALRKEDQDLKKALEEALLEVKKVGTFKKISENWFGTELGL